MRLWAICGALAAGEYAASFAPEFAPMWPVPALGAALGKSITFVYDAEDAVYDFTVEEGLPAHDDASDGEH